MLKIMLKFVAKGKAGRSPLGIERPSNSVVALPGNQESPNS